MQTWPKGSRPNWHTDAVALERGDPRGAALLAPSRCRGENAPLIFRLWRTVAPLAAGVWKIPIPVNNAELVPDVMIAPVVSFD